MKTFFWNIRVWFKQHIPTKRRLIQVFAALLYNANLKGFISGNIYTGASKVVCVPGFNCYSCPGAIGACPLGSLQAALKSTNKSALYYVVGIILLYGLILGRTICGWACPFGLIQDLLYKIPSKKIHKGKMTRVLSFLKYVVLGVFVFGITLGFASIGAAVPGFCKYICPAGTLEGAFMLVWNPANEGLLAGMGPLFTWKTFVLIACITLSVLMYRPFCRFLCPLGAIYSFFAPLNLIGIYVDKSKCTNCGLCVNKCKMDVAKVGDHECIQCGECISVCATKAISWKGSKFFLKPNDINTPAPEAKVDLGAGLAKKEEVHE